MVARNGASAARIGKATEREACRILVELTGYKVERKASEGIREDHGDLIGLPDTCVQVSRCGATPAAIWQRAQAKAAACAEQQRRRSADYGVTLLKVKGGPWRAVMTAAQFDDVALHGITDARYFARAPMLTPGVVILHGPTFTDAVLHAADSVYATSVERWVRLWAAALDRDRAL